MRDNTKSCIASLLPLPVSDSCVPCVSLPPSFLPIEIRHYNYKLRNTAQRNCNEHISDLERAQAQLKRYELSLSRGELAGLSHAERVGRLAPADQAKYMDERAVLLQGGQYVSESGASIDRSERVLIETQAIGAETHAKLEQQREQIQNQISNVHETNDFISRSKRTLMRMHRRLITSKILQGCIIITQMGACGLIVWLKYYK